MHFVHFMLKTQLALKSNGVPLCNEGFSTFPSMQTHRFIGFMAREGPPSLAMAFGEKNFF